MVRTLILRCFTLLVAAAMGSAVSAAPKAAPTPPDAQAVLVRPLSLVKLSDLDFGELAVTASGSATVSPTTGALTTSAGITRVGGTVSPARLRGAGTRLMLIIIRTPASVTLNRVGGPGVLTVDQFTLDGFAIRLIGATPFDFAVGGRLNIPVGAAEGTYSGTMDVTVEYF